DIAVGGARSPRCSESALRAVVGLEVARLLGRAPLLVLQLVLPLLGAALEVRAGGLRLGGDAAGEVVEALPILPLDGERLGELLLGPEPVLQGRANEEVPAEAVGAVLASVDLPVDLRVVESAVGGVDRRDSRVAGLVLLAGLRGQDGCAELAEVSDLDAVVRELRGVLRDPVRTVGHRDAPDDLVAARVVG